MSSNITFIKNSPWIAFLLILGSALRYALTCSLGYRKIPKLLERVADGKPS